VRRVAARPPAWAVGAGVILALIAAPLGAQTIKEWGIQALGALADPAFAGGGAYGALRFGDRTRAAVTLNPGVQDGQFAFRGELLGHLLINGRSKRPQVYALAGVAGVAGPTGRGWLVMGAGLEASPGGRSGWAVELGVGGGVRISAGFRWRRFPPTWVPTQ
jgi:hypothetical protein